MKCTTSSRGLLKGFAAVCGLCLAVGCNSLQPSDNGPLGNTDFVDPPAYLDICDVAWGLSGQTGEPVLNQPGILAWSLKEYTADRPPWLGEEAIVLFSLQAGTGTNWVLGYLRRFLTGYVAAPGNWVRGDFFRPGTNSIVVFTSKPLRRDVLAFLERTNFGNNECDEDVRVSSLICYEKDPFFRRALAKKLNSNERERRYMERLIP